MDYNQVKGLRGFFTYVIPFETAIAASGVASGSFVVQADCSFLWQQARAVCYNTARPATYAALQVHAQPIPLASVFIQDTQSGAQLSNNPTPIGNVFGIGAQAAYLPAPRLFPATTQVTLTVNNLDAAATLIVYFVFIGMKIYS